MIKGLEILSGSFGIFNHFLYSEQNNPESITNKNGREINWNELVDSIDTEKIAYNVNSVGAKYYFLTLMQGRKYMCSPNETFDKIAGTKPGEACSYRDLPLDMHKALSKYGIKLFLYYTGDGPWKDEEGKRFGFSAPRKNISEDFVQKWASVLEEYAVRYKDIVNGWWIDGCYADKIEGFGYTENMLDCYYKAVKKGNPDAAVAFNNGVKDRLIKYYKSEDFTAGEFNNFNVFPEDKFTDGALSHVLISLGKAPNPEKPWDGWAKPGLCTTKQKLEEYIRKVTEMGACVTIDIPLFSDSSFDKEQMDALSGILK